MSGLLLQRIHYLFRHHYSRMEYELYGKPNNIPPHFFLFLYLINSTEPAP